MRDLSKQSGFTLVEMAVVIAVVGALFMLLLAVVVPWFEYSRRIATENRMTVIARELALYAIDNNTLPCPGSPDTTPTPAESPYGFERDSGPDGADIDTDCSRVEHRFGIVPFRTLGLNEQDVRDGWGNYFTYHVTPVFALHPGGGNPGYDTAHYVCRTDAWLYRKGNGAYVNKNPDKARFCCPPIGTGLFAPDQDIRLYDRAGGALLWPHIRTSNKLAYGPFNDRVSVYDMDPTENPEAAQVDAVAFLLVSHGRNQVGAFDGQSTTSRVGVVDIPAGQGEQENSDGDRDYVFSPQNEQSGNNYFDDIVLWRTQSQIYSEYGDSSCLKP
jgi:prepilin-type N-terminal cleavage/methylation domain-containing protein